MDAKCKVEKYFLYVLSSKMDEDVLMNLLNKSTNVTSKLDEDDEDEDEGETISLSVRQPSFSNLTGHMVPKGQVSGTTLDSVDEDHAGKQTAVFTDPKSSSSAVYKSSSSVNYEINKIMEEEDDEEPEAGGISLGYRQPSFSRLDEVNPILKGDIPVKNIPTIIDEEGNNDAQLVNQLAARNAKRWKEIGYEPENNFVKNCSYQNFRITETILAPKHLSQSQNIFTTKNDKLHLAHAGSLFTSNDHLKLEMPDEKEENHQYMENLSEAEDEMDGLPQEYHLQLEEISKGQGYDSEQGSSRIPERIKEMLDFDNVPKESLTYLAMCQVSIVGYTKKSYQKTMRALEKYLNRCIKNGYIMESQYISDIIESNKQGFNELAGADQPTPQQILQDKLEKAKQESEECERQYKAKEMSLQNEMDKELQQLDINCQTDLDLLDETWSSPKVQNQYAKPSAELIRKRKLGEQLLKKKRFTEATQVASEAAELERVETETAMKKMQTDYENAVKKRKAKYKTDEKLVAALYEKKKCDLERKKIKEMEAHKNKIRAIEDKLKTSNRPVTTPNSSRTNATMESRELKQSETQNLSKTTKPMPDLATTPNQLLKLPNLRLFSRPTSSLKQSRCSSKTFPDTDPMFI